MVKTVLFAKSAVRNASLPSSKLDGGQARIFVFGSAGNADAVIVASRSAGSCSPAGIGPNLYPGPPESPDQRKPSVMSPVLETNIP